MLTAGEKEFSCWYNAVLPSFYFHSKCNYNNAKASNALSKTADSDTVSTYQFSSVQLVTDKKLEA